MNEKVNKINFITNAKLVSYTNIRWYDSSNFVISPMLDTHWHCLWYTSIKARYTANTGWWTTDGGRSTVDDTAKSLKPVLTGGKSSSFYLCLFVWNIHDTAPISNVMCRVFHIASIMLLGYNIRRSSHYLCMFDRRGAFAIGVDHPSVHLSSLDVNTDTGTMADVLRCLFSALLTSLQISPTVSMHCACFSLSDATYTEEKGDTTRRLGVRIQLCLHDSGGSARCRLGQSSNDHGTTEG